MYKFCLKNLSMFDKHQGKMLYNHDSGIELKTKFQLFILFYCSCL